MSDWRQAWPKLAVDPDWGLPVPFSSADPLTRTGVFGKNDLLATLFCAKAGLCGICGDPVEGEAAFLAADRGPVDVTAVVFADPPNHERCADQAMRLCPRIARRRPGEDRRGWLLLIAGSFAPGPPAPGSAGLVGWRPGLPLRLRRFGYDQAGRLTEIGGGHA